MTSQFHVLPCGNLGRLFSLTRGTFFFFFKEKSAIAGCVDCSQPSAKVLKYTLPRGTARVRHHYALTIERNSPCQTIRDLLSAAPFFFGASNDMKLARFCHKRLALRSHRKASSHTYVNHRAAVVRTLTYHTPSTPVKPHSILTSSRLCALDEYSGIVCRLSSCTYDGSLPSSIYCFGAARSLPLIGRQFSAFVAP